MTHEEIQSAYRTYRDSRGTPAEGDAADAFVAAVLSYEDNLPRALLDLAFWVACEAKKAEKPRNSEDGTEVGNPARFVHFARKVIALRGKIRRLPEGERRLTGAEARAYAWAVYAVATKGDDEEEVRASAELFERIYSFRTAHGWVPDEKDKQALERVWARIAANWTKVQEARVKAESGDVAGSVQCYHEAMQTGALSGSDARGYGWAMVKRVWRQDVQERELRFLMGDLLRLSQDALPLESENARKIRHGFLIGVSKRIHELEKRGTDGNRATIPYDVAVAFMQVADENCGLIQDDDFTRRALTPEERARMCQGRSGKLRLKAWPSNVETLVGVAARCVKTYADTPAHLQPGARLLDFLGHHLEAGEWFGFYYARWLKVVGRVAESARVLLKTVETKKDEAWAWRYLAECYAATDPQKARACYCRALLCPVHDVESSAAMARSTHQGLATVLQALHEDEAAERERALAQKGCPSPLPGQVEYYREYEDEAFLLLLSGKTARCFTGDFERVTGKDFGFVRCGANRRNDVFVPPPLARTFTREGRTRVKGVAVLKLDAAKGRKGWAAEKLRKI